MTTRPVIFISAVSKELRSARQLVANTLHLLGYESHWQDIFGTEEGDLRAMLRRRVDSSAGVVQLVGQCYGAEPRTVDEHFGRVSYTQYEALYAKERGKKVWYLFLGPDFTADPHEAEPEELRALQSNYREGIREGGQLYHSLGSTDALEARVLKLRDDLAHLRRRGKQWAAGVTALLILIAALVIWQVHSGSRTEQTVTAMQEEMRKLREGVAQYPQAEAKAREAGPDKKADQIEERTYAELAKRLGVDAKALREKLPQFAEQLKRSPDATTFERAIAAYVAKDYLEAERLALSARDEAQKAIPPRISDTIKALELAGSSAERRMEHTSALSRFYEAAGLTDRNHDPLEWARVQHEIAVSMIIQGCYPEADTILREVIVAREKALGPEHPDTIRSRIYLAAEHAAQGRYVEAEDEFQAVFKLAEKVLGPEHRDTLTCRTGLAAAHLGEGKYPEAEAEERAVLRLEEKVFGSEDPSTLNSRGNIATILAHQSRYAEAEAEYRAVLGLEEKVLGAENPTTLITRYGMAATLSNEGKYAEAEIEYRTILKIRQKVIGPEHPNTLSSQIDLADTLSSEGKYVDALAEYRAVLKLREKALGPDHADTVYCRNELAWLLATCPDSKIRNGHKAVELSTRVCEVSQWREANYIDTLAAAEAEVGAFESAVKHEQKALELAKQNKVDSKDFQSRLALYRDHKPYRE